MKGMTPLIQSKMRFSYWVADKVTIYKPVVEPTAAARVHCRRLVMEPSTNAKFGARLLNPDFSHSHPRPASCHTQATPTTRHFANSEDDHSTTRATVTITRPTWGDSACAAVTTTLVSSRPRTHNTS